MHSVLLFRSHHSYVTCGGRVDNIASAAASLKVPKYVERTFNPKTEFSVFFNILILNIKLEILSPTQRTSAVEAGFPKHHTYNQL